IPRPPIPSLFPYTTLFRSLSVSLWLSVTARPFDKPKALPWLNCVPCVSDEEVPWLLPAVCVWVWLADSPSVITSRNSAKARPSRSEEHTSELQSRGHLVCR